MLKWVIVGTIYEKRQPACLPCAIELLHFTVLFRSIGVQQWRITGLDGEPATVIGKGPIIHSYRRELQNPSAVVH